MRPPGKASCGDGIMASGADAILVAIERRRRGINQNYVVSDSTPNADSRNELPPVCELPAEAYIAKLVDSAAAGIDDLYAGNSLAKFPLSLPLCLLLFMLLYDELVCDL